MTSLSTGRNELKSPIQRAREMLRSVLPDEMWSRVVEKGVIEYTGTRATYIISPDSTTEIRDLATGRAVGRACLQLSVPAPAYDRMLAEYLLLRNAEALYWKTANIFDQNHPDLPVLIFGVLDICLFLHLLIQLL